MLRSIGSVTVLALLMVGCGGGGGGGGGTSSAPPPPLVSYTVGGKISGLQGSGLVLQQYTAKTTPCGAMHCPSHFIAFGPPLHITSNGPFSFGVDYSNYPGNAGSALVQISSEPASPSQLCRIKTGWFTPPADKTDIEVTCTYNSYVASAGDNTVSVYSVDAASGALTAVEAPVATGMSPHAIAATDDRQFVFVANEGSNDISAFAVDFATGALAPVPGSPFPAGTDPKSLALYRGWSGTTYLYVANAGSDTVSAFAIDNTNGSLTPLSTSPARFATGKGPSSIAIDPNRMTLYVANNGGSKDVSVFSIDPGQGSLAPVAGSPFPAGANPLSLTLESTGNFLYTANPDATNPSISGFRLDVATGALTPLSGSPFPFAVSHDITGRLAHYLYVTTGAGVMAYGVDNMTGALTALPGFPKGAGTNAYSMSINPSNQFLYVANDGAASVSGFRLDASTGALSSMAGSPFPAGNHPQFIATP